MWLLAEDDPDIRMVVSMMMTVWGEDPLAFPDGKTAWAWLDSVENGTHSNTLPDLALMDIRMPGYTGDQLAARIRTIPALKDIPIILMTAFSKTDSDIEMLRRTCGIDHLVNKPLPDMDDFRSILYRVRDERQRKAQAALEAAHQAAPGGQPETPPAAPVTNAPEATKAASVEAPVEAKPAAPSQPETPAAAPGVTAQAAPSEPLPADSQSASPVVSSAPESPADSASQPASASDKPASDKPADSPAGQTDAPRADRDNGSR